MSAPSPPKHAPFFSPSASSSFQNAPRFPSHPIQTSGTPSGVRGGRWPGGQGETGREPAGPGPTARRERRSCPSPRAGGGGRGRRAVPGPGSGWPPPLVPPPRSPVGGSPGACGTGARRMCGRWLLLLWALLPGAAAGGSGRTFPHRTLLDSEGKYWLSWGPRDARLAFRLEVRTAGYVGFGFSPTGAMAAADIVVGGVAQGRPYLQVSVPRSPPRPVPPRSGRGCQDHPGHRDGRAAGRTLPAALRSCPRSPSPPPRSGSELAPREAERGRLQAVFRF